MPFRAAIEYIAEIITKFTIYDQAALALSYVVCLANDLQHLMAQCLLIKSWLKVGWRHIHCSETAWDMLSSQFIEGKTIRRDSKILIILSAISHRSCRQYNSFRILPDISQSNVTWVDRVLPPLLPKSFQFNLKMTAIYHPIAPMYHWMQACCGLHAESNMFAWLPLQIAHLKRIDTKLSSFSHP